MILRVFIFHHSKLLSFCSVYFQKPNDYINFLSACPNLDDLHAKSIYMHKSRMNRSESNALEEGFKSLTLSKLVRASILSTNALLFNGINNVKFLRITLEYPSKGCLKFIPLFPNLIHIDVVFSDFTLNCWDVLEELLRRSPKLQLLFIKKVCLFASFFLFSFICFDKFNLIDHDVVEVLLWIQAGMEMSYFGF